jgi:hypothetical protein
MAQLVSSTRTTHHRAGARGFFALVACGSVLAGCAPGSADAAALPQWQAVEDLRIGGAGDPTQLSRVDQVVVDDEGTMFVLQSMEGRVRVFDADGSEVGAIGERGNEPGQFDRAFGMGLVADTVYVIDFGLRRVTYFSKEGDLIRTHQVSPPPAAEPFRPAMPFAVFADGSMAPGHSWPATVPMEALERVPQLRVDATSQNADTVGWLSYERTARRVTDAQQRPLMVGSPLTDDAFVIFAADGSRLVEVDRRLPTGSGPATFGVTVSDGWGDTIWTRRYDYEPIEIDDDVIEAAVTLGVQRLNGAFPDEADAYTFVRSSMFLPVSYPPVATALFSHDGTLWLQREAIRDQPQRWLVLDESGETTAETTLPEDLRVMAIDADAVWGVDFANPNAPSVVRYRVER